MKIQQSMVTQGNQISFITEEHKHPLYLVLFRL